MNNTNNIELIQAAQTGDDQAFATLINQHRALVCGTLWSILQDFDDAEDATQETFVLAYRNLNTLKDPTRTRTRIRHSNRRSRSFTHFLYRRQTHQPSH